MIKSTKQHSSYWANRKIDWSTSYLATWNHPHRSLITAILSSFEWTSLWDVGCGPGANLIRIVKESEKNPRLKNKQLGGSDINADAIELARKTFVGGKFHVESCEDMLLSDNATDVVLSDANLIYIGPTKINKVLKEMTRICRSTIVLCELHSTNLLTRWLYRFKTGYNMYNYQELLEKAGCYDIKLFKIPKEFWEGTPWETHGHIITAKVTKI